LDSRRPSGSGLVRARLVVRVPAHQRWSVF
jgi:hypothetical protein